MAVSPYDRRKKTRRAQLEDVDRAAVERFKAAGRVKRKLDMRDNSAARMNGGNPAPGENPRSSSYRLRTPQEVANSANNLTRRKLPPGVTAEGHADKAKVTQLPERRNDMRGSKKEQQFAEAAKRMVDGMARRFPQPPRKTGLVQRENTEKGNPRKGLLYRTLTDRKGRDVHVYGDGKRVTLPSGKPDSDGKGSYRLAAAADQGPRQERQAKEHLYRTQRPRRGVRRRRKVAV